MCIFVRFSFYRRLISYFTIFSMLSSQALWAGAADIFLAKDKNSEKLREEGFVGEEYLNKLKEREAFQQEQLNKFKTLQDLVPDKSPGNIIGRIDDAVDTAAEVAEFNSLTEENKKRSLKSSASSKAARIASYGRKFIKYGDGKKVWMFNGLVTDVENEIIYDKKGNKSLRNRRNMKYDDSYNLVSYQSSTKDEFGNVTTLSWSNGQYWSKEDEALNSRHKAGTLSSFTEERVDETGVSSKTVWENIAYYTEEDEINDSAKQAEQMAYYEKSEVSEASPERTDYIVTSDILYLERDKTVFEKSDDPKEAERRKSADYYKETLMTSFHEVRTTFDVVTERDWKNAEYNEYSELIYYEEESLSRGVAGSKVFKDAVYDSHGRMVSFREDSVNFGENTERIRDNTEYNDKNQVLSYHETVSSDGVTTDILKDQILYNELAQISSYRELSEDSEGNNRELFRSQMTYDKRGLMVSWTDNYEEGGLSITIERKDTAYDNHGDMFSYYEKRSEKGSYINPYGETVNIDRFTETERMETLYNENGLASSYHEIYIDILGLKHERWRKDMTYNQGRLISYYETEEVSGELSQSVLQENALGYFEKNLGEFSLTDEKIKYFYRTEKYFHSAAYKGAKLTAYTEEVKDSRANGSVVITRRTNQQYAANGKIASYDEERSTKNPEGESKVYTHWSDARYDSNGNLIHYKELNSNELGGQSEKVWDALSYNPVGLVVDYREITIQSGFTKTVNRSKTTYNEYDQLLSYDELINSGEQNINKHWQTLKGYNSVGLLIDYQEITEKDNLRETLSRYYMSYNEAGSMEKYAEELLEEGAYVNAAGDNIVIDRSSINQRVETLYDEAGREIYFRNFSRDISGTETLTTRENITYNPEGTMKGFLETSFIRSSFISDAILSANPLNIGSAGLLETSYSVIRTRTNTTYDGNSREASYTETVQNSRTPGLTEEVSRENIEYTGSGSLSHYNEELTKVSAEGSFNYSTEYTAEYNASGLLIDSLERTSDFLGTVNVREFEALSFNAIDLAESTIERTYTENAGGDRLGLNVRNKTFIGYNNLDQRISYNENELNDSGAVIKNTLWQGSYYDGSSLIRNQSYTEQMEGKTVIREDLARIYNAEALLIDSLDRVTESSVTINDEAERLDALYQQALSDATTINAAFLNSAYNLEDLVNNASLLKSVVSRKQVTNIDNLGREQSYNISSFEYNNNAELVSSKNSTIVNNVMLIDGRASDYSETANVTEFLAGSSINYSTTNNKVITGWDALSGNASVWTETLTDSRKSDGVNPSDWERTVERVASAYDNDNNLFAYEEIIRETAADGSLASRRTVNRLSTFYDDLNRETAYTETNETLMRGNDGVDLTVSNSNGWSGTYNSSGLLASQTITNSETGSSDIFTTENIFLYDGSGRELVQVTKESDPEGLSTETVSFSTEYSGPSAYKLSEMSLSSKNDFTMASLKLTDNLSYSNTGARNSWREDQYTFGSYYTDNFAAERGALGVSTDYISRVERTNSSYNNKGQLIAFSENKTIPNALDEVVNVDNIIYSLRGQEISSRTITDYSGAAMNNSPAVNYSVSVTKTVENFSAAGLEFNTSTVTYDSRSADIVTTASKEIFYNACKQADSYTLTTLVSECDGTGTPVASPAYYKETTVVRNNILYDAGRIIAYSETLAGATDTVRNADDSFQSENTPLTVITVTMAYSGDTDLLSSSVEMSVIDSETTVTSRNNIAYNHLDQQIGWQEALAGPDLITNEYLYHDVVYDACGRQLAYINEDNNQGIAAQTNRKNIVYDNLGRLAGYEELRREDEVLTPSADIDRLMITARENILYNGFGLVLSYRERATMYLDPADIAAIAPAYAGAVNDLSMADLAPSVVMTETFRENTAFTIKGQISDWRITTTLSGTMSLERSSVADAYSDPAAAITNALDTVTLNKQTITEYAVNSFDNRGRETNSLMTESKTYLNASGGSETYTTSVEKSNIVYDKNRLVSFVENTLISDTADPANIYRSELTRLSTTYDAFGRVSATTEQKDLYDGAAIIKSESITTEKSFIADSWLESSSITNSEILADTNPLLAGMVSYYIIEGLNAGESISYNSVGQRIGWQEISYSVNSASQQTPNILRYTDAVYSDHGQLTAYKREQAAMSSFDYSNNSLYTETSPGVYEFNGDYILTMQEERVNSFFDSEGRLLSSLDIRGPFGIEYPPLSDTANQDLYLYQTKTYIFTDDLLYDHAGRLQEKEELTWQYHDNPADGINLREDRFFNNYTYDMLGNQLGFDELLRTRQDTIDNYSFIRRATSYNGTLINSTEEIKYTELEPASGYSADDARAYSSAVTLRSFDNFSYDSLGKQTSYHFVEENGIHDNSVNVFSYTAPAEPKEEYIRSAINYDSRGRLLSYLDTYSYNNFYPTTGANALVIQRIATTYHDGVVSTTSKGYSIADDNKGKVKYTIERVTEGVKAPQEKEYSMEYYSETGLLERKNEYINNWKLSDYTVDALGRFTSYNAQSIVPDGEGGEDLFSFVKSSIQYASNDPASADAYRETGFSGTISEDTGNDGVVDQLYNGLNIDGMIFDAGELSSYHEIYSDDFSNDPENDVEIIKSEITADSWNLTITKDGQTLYVKRELLPDTDDGTGQMMKTVKDTYYTDNSFSDLLNPAVERTYYFSTEETSDPAGRLLYFVENEGAETVTYTANWVSGELEDFSIEGSGATSFTYQRVRYYRWGPYRGQIRSFRFTEAGVTSIIDNITWNMAGNPPVMTGYRDRHSGETLVYSNLTNASGFTLNDNGTVYSNIQVDAAGNISNIIYNGNQYSNITYTADVPPLLASFDLTTGSTSFTNVIVDGSGNITSLSTTENGIAVDYSAMVWDAQERLSSFTRTENGTAIAFSNINYNASNQMISITTNDGTEILDYTFSNYSGSQYQSMTIDNGTESVSISNIAWQNGAIIYYEQSSPSQSLWLDSTVATRHIFKREGDSFVNRGVVATYNFDFDNNGSNESYEAAYEIISVDALGRPTDYYITGVDFRDFTKGTYPRMVRQHFRNVTYDAAGRVTSYTVDAYCKANQNDLSLPGNYTYAIDGGYSISNIIYNGADLPRSYRMNMNGVTTNFTNASYDASGNLLSYLKNGDLWSIPSQASYHPSGAVTSWHFDGTDYTAVIDSEGGIESYSFFVFIFPITENVNSADRFLNQEVGHYPEFTIDSFMLPFNITELYNPAITTLSVPAAAGLIPGTAVENYKDTLVTLNQNLADYLDPITDLEISSRTELLSRYTHIEKEQLLHDMITFSSREVNTTEYFYNEYGRVTGIKTTSENIGRKTYTTVSDRQNITVDRLGRTLTFTETVTDEDGNITITERLSTQYDEQGNVIFYKQRITSLKKSTSDSEDEEAVNEEEGTDQEELDESFRHLLNSDEIIESVEVVEETVSGQKWNDKGKLLEFTKVTEKQETGTNISGEEISKSETITLKASYSYDDMGRLASSRETTNSSDTPMLTTIREKTDITYDENNRELSYNLNVTENYNDLSGNVLAAVSTFTTRTNSVYDIMGNLRSFSEERSSSNALQKQLVTKNIKAYDQRGRAVSYEEIKSVQGQEGFLRTSKSNITFDQYGREKSYTLLTHEKEPASGVDRLTVTQRKQTIIDAFGNLVKSLERSIDYPLSDNLNPESIFISGVVPEGEITEIVFTGGEYDSAGVYSGFTRVTSKGYGDLDFSGNLRTASIVERSSQTIDEGGRTTAYTERSWDASEPALTTTTSVSNIVYDQKNRENKRTLVAEKEGTIDNDDGSASSYYTKNVNEVLNVVYDEETGNEKIRETATSKYSSADQSEADMTVHSKTEILKSAASGRELQSRVTSSTQTKEGLEFSETLETETSYTSSGLKAGEETKRQVTEKGATRLDEEKSTSFVYDKKGNTTSITNETNDLLRNKARTENGQAPVMEISIIEQTHDQQGRVASKLTTSYDRNSSGAISQGNIAVESEITYTGFGIKKSWNGFNLEIKAAENPDTSVAVPERADAITPVNPLALPELNMLSISAAKILSNLKSSDSAQMPFDQTQEIARSLKLPEDQVVFKSLYSVNVEAVNSQGQALTESREGFNVVLGGDGEETSLSFKEKKENMNYDSRGNIISYDYSMLQSGSPEESYRIENRSYNSINQLSSETSSRISGYTPEGLESRSITEKTAITYDAEGNQFSFKSTTTLPDGNITLNERVSSTYTDSGKLLSSTQQTTYINNDGETLFTKETKTENTAFDAAGRVTASIETTGIINTEDSGAAYAGTEKTIEKKSSYDNIGRLKNSATKTTDSEGAVTTQDYTVTERDLKGRIVSSETNSTDSEGLKSTSSEKILSFDSLNRKTAVEESSSDAEGKFFHSLKSEITYDASGRESSYTTKDFTDSYEANPYPAITANIEYDAAGRRTSYSTNGTTKDGQVYQELRSNITYNLKNQIASFSSTGHNNGHRYSYNRRDITYIEQSGENGKKGQLASYTEEGIAANGECYLETHSDIKYDSEGRVISETVKGERAGKAFAETRNNSYYTEGENKGRLQESVTKSLINEDYTIQNNISYDEAGNKTECTTESKEDGKIIKTVVSQQFAKLSNGCYRPSYKDEKIWNDGKYSRKITSNIGYHQDGTLRTYKERGIEGERYTKTVSHISYNSLGQKVRMQYKDSRQTDFKTGDTLVETYRYDSHGGLSSSTLTTPDYIIRFDKNGNRIGDIQETASFQQWKQNEIRKQRAAAQRAARKRAEAQFLQGMANSTVATLNDGTPLNGMDMGSMPINSLYSITNGNIRGLNITQFYQSLTKVTPQGMASILPGYRQQADPAVNQITMLMMQMGGMQNSALFQQMVNQEMAKIRITTPNLSQAQINQAIANAIKLAIPDPKVSTKLLAALNNIKINAPNVQLTGMALKKGMAAAQGGMQLLPQINNFDQNGNLINVLQASQQTNLPQQLTAANALAQFGMLNLGAVTADKLPIKLYHYDENGNLASSEEISVETNEAGTKHTTVKVETYDQAGFVTGTQVMEKFKGPNEDYAVNTIYHDNGTVETLVHGQKKDDKTGQMKMYSEHSISTTQAINGGFIQTTTTTDLITGLKSVETNKYTGVKYGPQGNMIEFTLESKVSGERLQESHESLINQQTGKRCAVTGQAIMKVETVTITKQYGAQLDGQGRLLSYKQNIWSSSAPDKKVDKTITNTSFNENNQVSSKITETNETGSSVDGDGNPVTLDSTTIQVTTDMKYNANGQLTSYNEKTFTQEAYEPPTFSGKGSLADIAKEIDRFGRADGASLTPLTEKTVDAADAKGGIAGTIQTGATITVGGKSYSAGAGAVWGCENTSQSGMSYNHKGQIVWSKNAKGKASHTVYDHTGLVESSYDSMSKTRTYDINYSPNGQRTSWHTKTEGEQSTYSRHFAEYNTLGQMTYEKVESKSDGKKYKSHNITEKTFTYDAFGKRDTLKVNEIVDKMDGHTTPGQIVQMVAAVACMIIPGAQAIAAYIMTAAAAVGTAVDGGSFGDCLKAAAMAYVTAGMLPGGGEFGSGSLLKAATWKAAGEFAIRTWAVNTVTAMAQGASFGDAAKGAAIGALGAVAGVVIAKGLNALASQVGLGNIFTTPNTTVGTDNTVAIGQRMVTKMITQPLAQKINEKHSGEKAMLLNSLLNIAVSSALTESLPNDKELINTAIEGMVKGELFDAIERLRDNGSISDDMASFLTDAGLEIIGSIQYSEAVKEIGEGIKTFGNKFLKATGFVKDKSGNNLAMFSPSEDPSKMKVTGKGGSESEIPANSEVLSKGEELNGKYCAAPLSLVDGSGQVVGNIPAGSTILDVNESFDVLTYENEGKTYVLDAQGKEAVELKEGKSAFIKSKDKYVKVSTDKNNKTNCSEVKIPKNADNVQIKTNDDGSTYLTYDQTTTEKPYYSEEDITTTKTMAMVLDASNKMQEVQIIPGATDVRIDQSGLVQATLGKEQITYKQGSELLITPKIKTSYRINSYGIRVPVAEGGETFQPGFKGSVKVDNESMKIYTYNSSGQVGSAEMYGVNENGDTYLHSTTYNTINNGSIIVLGHETALFNGMGGIDSIIYNKYDVLEYDDNFDKMINNISSENKEIIYYEKNLDGTFKKSVLNNGDSVQYSFNSETKKTEVDFYKVYKSELITNDKEECLYQVKGDKNTDKMEVYSKFGSKVPIFHNSSNNSDFAKNNSQVLDIIKRASSESELVGIHFTGDKLLGLNVIEGVDAGENKIQLKNIFINNDGVKIDLPLRSKILPITSAKEITSTDTLLMVFNDDGSFAGGIEAGASNIKIHDLKNSKSIFQYNLGNGNKVIVSGESFNEVAPNTKVEILEDGYKTTSKVNSLTKDRQTDVISIFTPDGVIKSTEFVEDRITIQFDSNGNQQYLKKYVGIQGSYLEQISNLDLPENISNVQHLRDKNNKLLQSHLTMVDENGEEFTREITWSKVVEASVTNRNLATVGSFQKTVTNDVTKDIDFTNFLEAIGVKPIDLVNFGMAKDSNEESLKYVDIFGNSFIKQTSKGEEYSIALNKSLIEFENKVEGKTHCIENLDDAFADEMFSATGNTFSESSLEHEKAYEILGKKEEALQLLAKRNDIETYAEFADYYEEHPFLELSEMALGAGLQKLIPSEYLTPAMKKGNFMINAAGLACPALAAVNGVISFAGSSRNLAEAILDDNKKVTYNLVKDFLIDGLGASSTAGFAGKLGKVFSKGTMTASQINRLNTTTGLLLDSFDVFETGYTFYFANDNEKKKMLGETVWKLGTKGFSIKNSLSDISTLNNKIDIEISQKTSQDYNNLFTKNNSNVETFNQKIDNNNSSTTDLEIILNNSSEVSKTDAKKGFTQSSKRLKDLDYISSNTSSTKNINLNSETIIFDSKDN